MTPSIKSWRTTATGVLAIVIGIATAAKCELDGDPATVADWGIVATAILAGIGLIMARDAGISSEASGIK